MQTDNGEPVTVLQQVALQTLGEEENFQTLYVAGLRIEAADDVVAQLLSLLLWVRGPTHQGENIRLASAWSALHDDHDMSALPDVTARPREQVSGERSMASTFAISTTATAKEPGHRTALALNG